MQTADGEANDPTELASYTFCEGHPVVF